MDRATPNNKGETVTNTTQGIDFTKCGMTLAEYLGQLPHDSVLKAAAEAVRLEDEPIIVGIVHMDDKLVNVKGWATRERAAIRRWFVHEHGNRSGRMRLGTRTVLEPGTGQDITVVFVEYQPRYKTKLHSVAA